MDILSGFHFHIEVLGLQSQPHVYATRIKLRKAPKPSYLQERNGRQPQERFGVQFWALEMTRDHDPTERYPCGKQQQLNCTVSPFLPPSETSNILVLTLLAMAVENCIGIRHCITCYHFWSWNLFHSQKCIVLQKFSWVCEMGVVVKTWNFELGCPIQRCHVQNQAGTLRW